MLRNRLYYQIKPFVPWRIRIAIRSWLALRKRRRVQEVWPVLPGSEQPPSGWPGWPDGKKFALVLTHDVERPEGLAKCRQLAELEIQMGFRSSFNFIPEGPYAVPAELRTWLADHGFEVGVHDLHHDGRLFESKAIFRERSLRINEYLRVWGAAGFRSGFMLNERDWLHELGILYDSSTFDTDPFEPHPQGRKTIFPSWVPNVSVEPRLPNGEGSPSRTGYLELPYTLPQDSTLFLLLHETTPEIWTKKLDWIAGHGGMALVNVHPDYLRFEGDPSSWHTYPVGFYVQFLTHVRQRYADTFWHALPKDVSLHCRKNLGGTSGSPRKAV